MKNDQLKMIIAIILMGILVVSAFGLTSFRNAENPKIGFLVHDLISERWQMDMDIFTKAVEGLGGEAISDNAFGDPQKQVALGKTMIDQGVKVLAVVAQDATKLGELVNYANKKGVKVIAYDRMIMNCRPDFYVSFNSVKVGEEMTKYALKLKPKGNYIILNGPSADNNALLVRKGVMNILKPHIDKGDVNVIFDKESESWYSLTSLMMMEDFLSNYKGSVDVVLAANDDLAAGAIEALENHGVHNVVVTGQDAGLEACKLILQGKQAMSVYKPINKIASEAAKLAMKIARGESLEKCHWND